MGSQVPLPDQVSYLQREKAAADRRVKRKESILEIQSRNLVQSRRETVDAKEQATKAEQEVKALRDDLTTTKSRLESKRREVTRSRLAERAAQDEARRLRDDKIATADAIEAMREFLVKNVEVTGSSFFGRRRGVRSSAVAR